VETQDEDEVIELDYILGFSLVLFIFMSINVVNSTTLHSIATYLNTGILVTVWAVFCQGPSGECFMFLVHCPEADIQKQT
jgi:hypothetical protein